MKAETLVREGDTQGALGALTAAVRDNPADASLRVFLFQLLCVLGDWNRALNQLNVAAELDAENLLLAQTYRELLQCEAYRQSVFRGERAPLVFGEPGPWLAKLLQALPLVAAGNGSGARSHIDAALADAPARAGSIDGEPFEWLADADLRLGPVLEAVINGRYYWVPLEQVAVLTLSPPEDLRDLVWLPVHVKWVTEGTSIGFMPVRYPGEHTLASPAAQLARRTDWHDRGGELFTGSGQRMFTTGDSDYPVLQTRKILFETPAG